MKYKLSIVSPCYNEEKRISPFLKSLEAQTVKPEIIFVDGGSSDRTVEIIESFMRRNINMRLLKEAGSRSPANARNIGIKAATGNLLVVLNADSILEKDYTKKIVEGFTEHPDADAVTFNHKPILPKMNVFERALFLRDEIYGYAGKHGAMKTAVQRKAGFYDPKLGFGEDRLIRRAFAKMKIKTVHVDNEISMSQTSYPDIGGFFSRCLWYGRTLPMYLKKEMNTSLAAFYALSIIFMPLLFLSWINPLHIALLAVIAVPFLYGIFRSAVIIKKGYPSKALILLPFLEIISFVGIGAGFYQYLFGNRTIGR